MQKVAAILRGHTTDGAFLGMVASSMTRTASEQPRQLVGLLGLRAQRWRVIPRGLLMK
jgi:hypothetical protein